MFRKWHVDFAQLLTQHLPAPDYSYRYGICNSPMRLAVQRTFYGDYELQQLLYRHYTRNIIGLI